MSYRADSILGQFGQSVFAPNDLEGQGQIPPYTISSANNPRYTCNPNSMILVAFYQKLSRGQASSYRQTDGQTDGRTDGHGQRQYRPLRPKWPRGNKLYCGNKIIVPSGETRDRPWVFFFFNSVILWRRMGNGADQHLYYVRIQRQTY